MAHALESIRAALAAQYQVERELGHGGMATVYLAEDLKHGRKVAIKVLDPDLSGLLGPERFVREIRTAAQLQHPNILPLLDSGAIGTTLYYVMPYVPGESLRTRLDAARQLPIDEGLRLAAEIARALDYSHRQGMVHRDIKPENVLLVDGQAVVADFGIARAIQASGGEKLTQTGVSVGSPPYMSPEQSAGGVIDGRSDLYSLGCLLYEMLAGQPPFTGPPASLAHQHLNLAARPLRDLRPTVPVAVDAAVARALAKTPADRFATGAEFAAALGTAASAAAPAVAQPPVVSAARRPSFRTIALAIGFLALAGVAFVMWRVGALGHAPTVANPANRRWVWLADFEGPADDPSLAPTARDLVAATLDQSEIIATVPVDQVRIALRNAGRPDSIPLTPALSRELAFRSTIPVVVEGRIGKLGGKYSIVLRATNAEDGRVVHTATGEAPGEGELAPVITRLARDLRRGLGERPQALTGGVWTDAATPSFEAFKLFALGRRALLEGDSEQAAALFRQALAIDGDFATAWANLGTALGNAGHVDSALVMQQKALEHADRLSTARRFDIEGKIARYRGDLQGSIAAYDAMLQLNPSPADRSAALNNKGLALSAQGRNAEALDLFRESAAVAPIEPPQITLANEVDQLTALRRWDEAALMLPKLRGPSGLVNAMVLAIATRRWDRADSLAALLGASGGALQRGIAASAGAANRAVRGDVTSALRMFEELERAGTAAHAVTSVGVFWMEHFWLSRIADRGAVGVPAIVRGSPWGVAANVTTAALAGDSTAVRAALETWPAGEDPESRSVLSEHAEGLIDWRHGRWSRAIARLVPIARDGQYRPPNVADMVRSPSRWIAADAFAQLGQRDSAVVYLHLLLDPDRPSTAPLVTSGNWEPFARRRLVALYAEMGRLDEARREWETLSATTVHPDPQMTALLDETRAQLQAASAMGSGAKR